MKIISIIGWLLLAVEALLVIGMVLNPNVGDDAAGRGMARVFAIVLGPILLGAAALFVWGQRGGPRPAFWIGFGMLAIPLVFLIQARAASAFNRLDRAGGRLLYGRFDDRRLTALARAVESEDTTAVREIIAQGPIDFTARSRRGRTILGRSIEYAASYDATPNAVESVRLLLAAGGKPEPNVIEPESIQGDLDAHLLVAYLFGGNSQNTIPLLDLVLRAGADPDTRNYEGQPLYFSTYATPAKLEVLANYGADFTALETTRADRAGYTGAMSAAELGMWDVVTFLLDHGVSAEYVTSDGNSLRKIVAEKARANDSAMAAVVQRLVRK